MGDQISIVVFMQLLPIKTPLLQKGDDLVSLLMNHADVQDNDIVIVSSKAIATVEGAAIKLASLIVSDEARSWAEKSGLTPMFTQAIIEETVRLRGKIIGYCPKALLCELKPEGLQKGAVLAPNAGLDESNSENGYAIGWPTDPVSSVKKIRSTLTKNVAVIISDSCCRPRRIGVTAFALTACGVDPFRSEVGKQDLFGKELQITVESVADQLVTAANILMGNAAQSIPAVIIRDHQIPFTSFCGWVQGIEPEEDLFRSLF